MTNEVWNLQTKIKGDFYIRDEHIESGAPLIVGLIRIEILPEFDKEEKYTGSHQIEAEFIIENQGELPLEPHIIYDRAKLLVDNIISIVSLAAGRSVQLSGQITLKHRLNDEKPKYRFIMGSMAHASISPPLPIPASLLTIAIPPIIQRAIRWLAHGLATNDAIDRLIALNNALDILAGMVEGAPNRIRRCNKCEFEETIGPGLRERVVYYLTDKLGYSLGLAESIYESRIDLSHGRTDLQPEDLRRYREHAIQVTDAVRSGIAHALSITLPPLPIIPFDGQSAILDLITENPAEPNN